MQFLDTLFYWTQLKLVANTRPDDEAARDSLLFFAQILSEDHELTSFDITGGDNPNLVYVTYRTRSEPERLQEASFDRESAEQLLTDLLGVRTFGMPDVEDNEVNEE